PNDSYLLMAAHAAGIEPDLVTALYARRILSWQREDGHWMTSDFRPPHSSSLFTATATALRAVRLYAPADTAALAAERDAATRRAREWLLRSRPVSTEDAAFRVMGLVWAGAARGEIALASRDLLALARPGGGWGQFPGERADAYSTGEALFALHEAGRDHEAAWRKGVRYLLAAQAADGTWRVPTRMLSPAQVSPPYFTTGFPYGKSEYLSYAGSCWAVMALLTALPAARTSPAAAGGAPASAPVPEDRAAAPVRGGAAPRLLPDAARADAAAGQPEWARPVLFGAPERLAQLLDAGLDPNSATAGGTTLLMMAAPDPEKVRLLLARGADVRARARNGWDALTVAAGYRGTAESLRLLLDAGAEVDPPPAARASRS